MKIRKYVFKWQAFVMIFGMIIVMKQYSTVNVAAAVVKDIDVFEFIQIKDAIDAADNGDMLNFNIKNDIIFENVAVIKKGITINLINSSGGDVTLTLVKDGTYRHFSTPTSIDNISITIGSGIILDGGGTGGGIWVYGSACRVTFDGCIIRNCVNSINGGGAFVGGGIVKSTLVMNNVLIENCRSGNGGGGVFGNDCDIEMNGGIITGNYASLNGGGITAAAGGNKLGSTLTISGGKISGNTMGSSGDGGGINAHDTIVTIRDSEISYNTADNYGGGIHIMSRVCPEDKTKLIINNSTIEGNKTRNVGGGIGIQSKISEFTITNSLITKNESVSPTVSGTNQGGGIYFLGGSTLTLSDGKVTGNKAGKGGGGILVNGATLILTGNAEISENQSDIIGGGIYGYYGAAITIQGNAKVINNGAKSNEDDERLYGGGGAVALYASDLTVKEGAVISGNTALSYGGGIWTYPDFTPISTVTIEGGTIESNSANYGGAISMGAVEGYSPALTITDGTITKNIAAKDGGGIISKGSSVSIFAGNITANIAGIDGGGIWMDRLENLIVDSVAEPNRTILSDNTASAAYEIAESDIPLHESLIKTTQVTNPFKYGYNNYDINYKSGRQFDTFIVAEKYVDQNNKEIAASSISNIIEGGRYIKPALEISNYKYIGAAIDSSEELQAETIVTINPITKDATVIFFYDEISNKSSSGTGNNSNNTVPETSNISNNTTPVTSNISDNTVPKANNDSINITPGTGDNLINIALALTIFICTIIIFLLKPVKLHLRY